MPVDIGAIGTIRQVLKAYGLRAASRLSQNFIFDDALLRRIAASLHSHGCGPRDIVVEVGAGIQAAFFLLYFLRFSRSCYAYTCLVEPPSSESCLWRRN